MRAARESQWPDSLPEISLALQYRKSHLTSIYSHRSWTSAVNHQTKSRDAKRMNPARIERTTSRRQCA